MIDENVPFVEEYDVVVQMEADESKLPAISGVVKAMVPVMVAKGSLENWEAEVDRDGKTYVAFTVTATMYTMPDVQEVLTTVLSYLGDDVVVDFTARGIA